MAQQHPIPPKSDTQKQPLPPKCDTQQQQPLLTDDTQQHSPIRGCNKPGNERSKSPENNHGPQDLAVKTQIRTDKNRTQRYKGTAATLTQTNTQHAKNAETPQLGREGDAMRTRNSRQTPVGRETHSHQEEHREKGTCKTGKSAAGRANQETRTTHGRVSGLVVGISEDT